MNFNLAEKIRKHDYERYFCSLFAPEKLRNALLALYAFNLEIAKTRESISEPMLGMIRLQWWREAIAEIYAGKPRRHEVVDELAPLVKEFGLSEDLFLRMIDAREKDLDEYPPARLEDLWDYAEKTSSALLLLAAEILGCRNSGTEDFLISLGRAWAACGLLRAAGYHLLPTQLFKDKGNEEKFAEGAKSLAAAINIETEKCRAILGAMDKDAKKALRPVSGLLAFLDVYMKRMKKRGYKILRHKIEEPRFPILVRVVISSF